MQKRWDIGIGLFGFLFAVIALTIWFPNDIKGEFVGLTRAGRPEPGDAFFPVLLGVFIAFISICLIYSAFGQRQNTAETGRITTKNLVFLTILGALIGGSLTLMFWLGPLAVWLSGVDATYRQLVDSAPYKYIGLVIGGFVLTFSVITWAEGRIRPRSAIVSVLLLIVIILVFDVMLTNIQLPPNADY